MALQLQAMELEADCSLFADLVNEKICRRHLRGSTSRIIRRRIDANRPAEFVHRDDFAPVPVRLQHGTVPAAAEQRDWVQGIRTAGKHIVPAKISHHQSVVALIRRKPLQRAVDRNRDEKWPEQVVLTHALATLKGLRALPLPPTNSHLRMALHPVQ